MLGEDGTVVVDYPMLLTATAIVYSDQGWTLLPGAEGDEAGGWKGTYSATRGDEGQLLYRSRAYGTREEALRHAADLDAAIQGGKWTVGDRALAHGIVEVVRRRGWFNSEDPWSESYRIRVNMRRLEAEGDGEPS